MAEPTDGAVFDALHKAFGVGDYDEGMTPKPWHEWRVGEITKIKATRTKRQVLASDLLLAIEYCAANAIDIRSHVRLYEHINAAVRWRKAKDEKERNAVLDQKVSAAIAYEAEQADSIWLDRFLRATGTGIAEVYAEWLRRK